MRFQVNGEQVFASTGGRDHVEGQEWIVFLHGAGQSHLTWSQQVRAFAYDGYNVLALDLPAHGGSKGEALDNPEEMADWVIDVMDALNIEKAHLVNHSMGGLISLELGARYDERVQSIVFIATAMTIAVGEILIEWAKTDQRRAIDMMTSMGMSSFGHHFDTSVPGTSLIGSGVQIMESNDISALPADLTACVSYKAGKDAAANIQCPTLGIVSTVDRMVKAKFGEMLCDAIGNSKLHKIENGGHMLPAERPREINEVMRGFYNSSNIS